MSDKKIVLINPFSYPEASSGKMSSFLAPMPPIGLAYLLAVLERDGHDPLFYDDFLEKGDSKKFEQYFSVHKPDIVGIPLFTSPEVYRAYELVAMARALNPDVTIVFGNLHAMTFASQLLEDKAADIIVMGEGEDTICDLMKAWNGHMDLADVPGIMFRSADGEIRTTVQRQCAVDIGTLPFPAWHRMPVHRYDYLLFEKISNAQIFLLPSRGCPFQCNFCSSANLQGGQRRVRSAENIIAEIKWVMERFGFTVISFMGPAFPFSKEEGMSFCRALKQHGLHTRITWLVQTRIDCVDEELLREMYSAGCRKILYGIESGSQEMLDTVRKRTKLDHIRHVVRETSRAGIAPVGLFVIGLPGETERLIEETISFACSLDLESARFAVFVPYPGTPFFDQLNASNKLDTRYIYDWNCYTTDPVEDTPAVYINEALSIRDIVSLQSRAHLKFYLRPKTVLRLLRYIPLFGGTVLSNILRYFMKECLKFFSGGPHKARS